jgi:hypothetical protein
MVGEADETFSRLPRIAAASPNTGLCFDNIPIRVARDREAATVVTV